MKIKISDRTKSIVKFETKLLLVVLAVALLEFYLLNQLIYKSADFVANAYTQNLQ